MADPHHSATDQADADATAYLRGSQTIHEQTATYSLFMNLAKWGSLTIAVSLLFLVLWFQPGGSLMTAFIAAVVLAVAGGWFLRGKPKDH